MVRASLAYSFLPGESLWKDPAKGVRAKACASDNAKSAKTSSGCDKLLAASEKARQEWTLEKAFVQFESRF